MSASRSATQPVTQSATQCLSISAGQSMPVTDSHQDQSVRIRTWMIIDVSLSVSHSLNQLVCQSASQSSPVPVTVTATVTVTVTATVTLNQTQPLYQTESVNQCQSVLPVSVCQTMSVRVRQHQC